MLTILLEFYLMHSDISNVPLCQIIISTKKSVFNLLWHYQIWKWRRPAILFYMGQRFCFLLMLVHHDSCHKLSMFTTLCSGRTSSGVYPEHSLILTLIHIYVYIYIYIYNTYVYIYLKNTYVYKYHCVDVCNNCIKKIKKTFH